MAVVIFALQLPPVTFLLTVLVVELIVGAVYSVAMSFVLRRVKKRESLPPQDVRPVRSTNSKTRRFPAGRTLPTWRDGGFGMASGKARRKRKTLIVNVLLHVVLAGIIGAVGVALSVEALGILAAAAIVFVMLLVSAAYFRAFGSKSVGQGRQGPIGLSRGYMLFVSWLILGYLAVLLLVGAKLSPSDFVIALAGFYVLFVVFVGLILVWGKQRRREAAETR